MISVNIVVNTVVQPVPVVAISHVMNQEKILAAESEPIFIMLD
jgi:hypothetical protein